MEQHATRHSRSERRPEAVEFFQRVSEIVQRARVERIAEQTGRVLLNRAVQHRVVGLDCKVLDDAALGRRGFGSGAEGRQMPWQQGTQDKKRNGKRKEKQRSDHERVGEIVVEVGRLWLKGQRLLAPYATSKLGSGRVQGPGVSGLTVDGDRAGELSGLVQDGAEIAEDEGVRRVQLRGRGEVAQRGVEPLLLSLDDAEVHQRQRVLEGRGRLGGE
eukprot:1804119-Rhodomonas_salina.1